VRSSRRFWSGRNADGCSRIHESNHDDGTRQYLSNHDKCRT
jgi:hypothetical protein